MILARLAALELVDGEVAEREELLRRLDEVRRSLQAEAPRSPLLRSLRIVRACPASWASMQGDHRVRHCGQCDRKVYNLTAMMPEEVETFLRSRSDAPCVRMYARPDGYYQDGPCVPGERRTLARALAVAVSLGLGGLAALLSGDRASAAVQPQPASAEAFDADRFLTPPAPSRPVPSAAAEEGPQEVMGAIVVPGFLDAVATPSGRVSVVTEGGSMAPVVGRMFEAQREAISHCYDHERLAEPELEGDMRITLSVAASGEARVTALDRPANDRLRRVTACAVRVADAMRFSPATEDEVVVRITLRRP